MNDSHSFENPEGSFLCDEPIQVQLSAEGLVEQSQEGIEPDYASEERSLAPGDASGSSQSQTEIREAVSDVSIGFLASAQPENRLVMQIAVAGSVCDALIDTGATTSMVSAHWLQDQSIEYLQDHSVSISGFGAGNVLRVVGQVELSITLSGIAVPWQMFTVVDAGRSGAVALILAEDFLQYNNMTVDVANGRLRQLTSGGFVDYYVNKGRAPTRIVRHVACTVAEDCVVSSDQWAKVNVESPALSNVLPAGCGDSAGCEEDCHLLYEPLATACRVDSLPGIINCEQPAVLAMAAKKPVHLRRGDVVGTLSTVVSLPVPELSGEVGVAASCDAASADEMKHTIPDHLSLAEREIVIDLLKEQEKVFSFCDEDIGQLGLTRHRIELLDDTPIYQKPRRFPEPVSEEIEAQCQELHLLDIIEPSKSSWSSPVVPVRKKDGKLRLCVDYRKLNAVTKPDRYPLPNLTDSVYSLHGVKYFSSVDVVRGFYHLQLEEASKEITAFSSPRGHWQFKRLPFGLRNAPSAFQREMQCVLSGFSHHNVIVYIDDVLIMSVSFNEHVEMVRKVLTTLSNHGVKIKPTKCKWFEKEVEYLGHVIGRDGIRKSASFMEKIEQFPRPETVKQMREFLGLANFQRKFVPNFSEVQKPLSAQTGGRGKKKLRWTEDMEVAFTDIKKLIVSDVTLAFPDYSEEAEPLELYVDASGVGAGACLLQKQDNDTKIIAYASTTFSPAEYHYSTIERELAALRWGIKAVRPFIIGTEFILHTDHQPLIYLHNMKIIDSRLARTLEDLSDFNFRIQYTPGKQNTAADALSRLQRPGATGQWRVQVEPGKLPVGLIVVKEVPGGGDSVFESLHILASNSSNLPRPAGAGALELRELLVDELLARPEVYKISLDRDRRKFLRLMRLQGQLPGVEIFYAFSQLFGCCVMLHYGGDWGVSFVSPAIEDCAGLPRVHLQCLAGVHYNPVVEMDPVSFNSSAIEERVTHAEPADSEGNFEDISEDSTLGDVHLSMPAEQELEDPWCSVHRRAHVASVPVRVGDGSCCALLDSGAQVSCVAQGLVGALHMPVTMTNPYVINGLGAGSTPVLGIVDVEFQLPGSNCPVQHSLAVVPDDALPYCMILGVDFLVSHLMEIDYGAGTLRRGEQTIYHFPLVPGGGVAPANFSLQYSHLPSSVVEIGIGTMDESVRFSVNQGPGGAYVSSLLSLQEVKKLQRRSSLIAAVKRQLTKRTQHWPRKVLQFKRYREDLVMKEDILFHGVVPVVTFSVLVELVLVIHHQMTHLGRQKLIEMTRRVVWHPSIAKVAGDISTSCDWCQRMKVSSIVSPPIHKIQTSVPFELVTLDLLNLPRSQGFGAALVVVDHNSKWMNVIPLSSKTSSAVSAAFERRVLPFLPRKPDKVLTDNGPEFVGGSFNGMLDSYGIGHVFTTPNRPPSNGLVERTNRTLSELLRLETASEGNWMDWLPGAVMVYNHTFHSALNCSPSEYLLQREHPTIATPIISTEVVDKWREGNPAFGTF